MPETTRPSVLIDCDPGHDDALAKPRAGGDEEAVHRQVARVVAVIAA